MSMEKNQEKMRVQLQLEDARMMRVQLQAVLIVLKVQIVTKNCDATFHVYTGKKYMESILYTMTEWSSSAED